MKKLILLLSILFLVGCAHSKPSYEDRTESNKEYAKEEAKNQERSLEHSEVKTRIKAITARIGAINDQIKNQQDLIAQWKEQEEEVASSEAMIANAKLRIEQLKKERADLVDERKKWKEKLED